MNPSFRAWDKETQTMLDVSLIDFKKSVLIGEHWEFGETNFINFDEIELMQSTGLKDKNGKEIFEGDILTSQNYPVKGVVEFRTDLGLWVHYLKGYNYFEYLGNVAGSKEIIGNIYENQEILKEKE